MNTLNTKNTKLLKLKFLLLRMRSYVNCILILQQKKTKTKQFKRRINNNFIKQTKKSKPENITNSRNIFYFCWMQKISPQRISF